MRNKEGKKKKKREWRIERAAVTMNVKSPEAKPSLFLVLLRFVAQNGKKRESSEEERTTTTRVIVRSE